MIRVYLRTKANVVFVNDNRHVFNDRKHFKVYNLITKRENYYFTVSMKRHKYLIVNYEKKEIKKCNNIFEVLDYFEIDYKNLSVKDIELIEKVLEDERLKFRINTKLASIIYILCKKYTQMELSNKFYVSDASIRKCYKEIKKLYNL